MKTFREFVLIAEDKMGERLGKMSDSDFEQFLKGRTSGEAKTYREKRVKFRKTKVSGEDIRGSKQTQTPPKQSSTSTPPPKQPSTSTPPPKKPTGGLSTQVKPPAPKGPGLRTRLGNIVGPAANVASAAMDYKERRAAGQSRARAAGGAASSLAGFAAGAKIGAMVPGPPIVKGAAALGAGMLGAQKSQQIYDYAADKSRPARQAVSRATGFDKFQQKNVLIKPGSGLSGVARAQQTVDTRGAREVAAKAGTYGTRQGSAITGIGPRTTFNQRAGTITSQGRTANLASTQLVRDPKTGQQRVGDLAYKGGKAVYLARPSVASRDTSLTARLGRALNIGRYSRDAEQQAARQEYRTALKNTQTYQKQLGITPTQATTQKLPGR